MSSMVLGRKQEESINSEVKENERGIMTQQQVKAELFFSLGRQRAFQRPGRVSCAPKEGDISTLVLGTISTLSREYNTIFPRAV